MAASMIPSIVPVILSGGSGTRLWPLSRTSYPKQFAPMFGETSLFQETVVRLPETEFGRPVIVTHNEFRFIAVQQMMAIERAPGAVLIEPEARNTAPAVLAAALHIAATSPDALMLVCPADHAIAEPELFLDTVRIGASATLDGSIVTFGVVPTRAETGYGWLELDRRLGPDEAPRPMALRRFVEKPDAGTAGRMLRGGRHLWNSGIFLFQTATIIAAFEQHQPEMLASVRTALESARPDLGLLALDREAWSRVEDISIDFAIMERAANLKVVPLAATWSDLGSWDAVARRMESDSAGVARSGPAYAIGCTESVLRAENDDQVLVGIGLNNIAAIAMRDAVLVADLRDSQSVKQAVEILRMEDIPQATGFRRCHRPWGWYESLALGHRFQVKRIMVNPGGILSLQSHYHRAEHWVVVEGTARVTRGGETMLLSENESVYIPLGTHHRLENPGMVELHLIEVQSGPYLGEDDIVRYEDVYART